MKELYEAVNIELIYFDSEDVIATSYEGEDMPYEGEEMPTE